MQLKTVGSETNPAVSDWQGPNPKSNNPSEYGER